LRPWSVSVWSGGAALPRGKRTERISERDLEVLAFIARFGVVPRDAVASWAQTQRTVTQTRERRLREAGLLRVLPRFGEDGPILLATREGLGACGHLELRPAPFSASRVRHEAIVARLAARLEAAGERLLSEREMLAAERAEGERLFAATLPGGRRHHADLVRVCAPLEAIEVELTSKGAARLDAILRGWRRAVAERHIGRVSYRCSPATLRHVERAVKRTRTGSQIAVEPLQLAGPG
jgi:hypothetical protein